MCCIFTILLLLGPRVIDVIWWIANPLRWELAFNSVIWPILGIIFVPWTTLMYMIVFPGGVVGFDWVWIGLAVGLACAAVLLIQRWTARERLGLVPRVVD